MRNRHHLSTVFMASLVLATLLPAAMIVIFGKGYPYPVHHTATYFDIDFFLIGILSLAFVGLGALFFRGKSSSFKSAIYFCLSLFALSKLIPIINDDRLLIALLSFSAIACLLSFYQKLPRLTVIIFFLLALLASVDLVFITQYNSVLGAVAFSLLLESNRSELRDLFNSITWHLWLILFYFIFACTFCLYAPKKFKHIPWVRLLFYNLGVILVVGQYQYNYYKTNFLTDPDSPFTIALQEKDEVVRAAFPACLPFILSDFYSQRKEMRRVADLNKSYDFHAQRHATSTERQVYILVIGESGRADHWGINGYQRNTSPMLSARNDIISFRKMFTYFPMTRYSVPVIISRKPINDRQDYFSEPSIVTYFKQIGFDTAWISLQAPFGKYDSPVSIYAYEANRMKFLNPVEYTAHGKYDYEAIPDIMQQIDSTDQNLFLVVHTLGNHMAYIDRYNERMRVFLPDRHENRTSSIFKNEDREVLTNSYDNSVVAVDYFLGTLINQLQQRHLASFVFYVSDHGQGLFDDGQPSAGHGYRSFATLNVAAFFWASPDYIAENPEKIQALRQNANGLTATSMVFDTLVSLSGGELPDSRPSLDMTKLALRFPDVLTDIINELHVQEIHEESIPSS